MEETKDTNERIEGEVVIRRGTAAGSVAPSTEADFAYVNANLRDLDRFEQDFFAERLGEPRDALDQLERAWTLRLKGEIVGYVGLQVPPAATPLSAARIVPMLSTRNVAHHPLDFARLSRPILEWTLRQAPPWVTDFWSFPLARYAASVRWHEKTMGWTKAGEADVLGERVAVFHITRKEI